MRSTQQNEAILARFTTATEPIADYVHIDYELGRMMLDRNIEPRKGVKGTNRRSAPVLVDRHRDTMLNDEWLPITNGIGFNTRGELVDGAHRLKGFLKACQLEPNLTIHQLVCGGLDPKVKRVIDTGRKRSDQSQLQMEGHVDVNRLRAVLRLVHCYLNVPYEYKTWEVRAPFNTDAQLELVAQYPEIQEAVAAGGRMSRNFEHLTATAAAVTYFIGWTNDLEEEVDWFNDHVVKPINLQEGAPVLELREFLRRNDKKHTTIIQLAYWLKAFNAHLAGKPVQLSFKPTMDRFPYLSIPAGFVRSTKTDENDADTVQ